MINLIVLLVLPDTPMVIMWANADGTITLSQRQAPATVMPTPVANPPHIATPAPQLSSVSEKNSSSFIYLLNYSLSRLIKLTGSQPKLVFTIPVCGYVLEIRFNDC